MVHKLDYTTATKSEPKNVLPGIKKIQPPKIHKG